MDNQMKVCFISLEQYNKLWTKFQPQQRFTGDLPTLALIAKQWNTLFIVGNQEDFLTKPEDVIPEAMMVEQAA